jgi:molybdenum cofactor cytidylyltransferase
MGFPKALLRYRDESFLDTLIGLFSTRCSEVIVVLGAHEDRIRQAIRRPATLVTNPGYLRGQTTSMQCGLRAVPADVEGVLFTLVDHPAVQPETLDILLAGRGMPAPLVRVPRYQGHRGHPVWFHRHLLREFLDIPEGGAANQIVRSHAAETEFLDVDDAGILADIDDAAAYVRLTGAAL